MGDNNDILKYKSLKYFFYIKSCAQMREMPQNLEIDVEIQICKNSNDLLHRHCITVRKRSCGKVMFSQACVKNSVHKRRWCTLHWADTPLGRNPPGQTPLGRHPPWAEPPPPRQTDPLPSPADGYCSGRSASYWNAFLFTMPFCSLKASNNA